MHRASERIMSGPHSHLNVIPISFDGVSIERDVACIFMSACRRHFDRVGDGEIWY